MLPVQQYQMENIRKLFCMQGIIHLPTSRSRFTVLSGPHVHKKSREQFERITRQVRLEFELDQEAAEVFHELLKNM